MRRFDEEWRLMVEHRPWLAERGYRLVESRGPEGMDQGFDRYVGKTLKIAIYADRSQWFIEIEPIVSSPDLVGLQRASRNEYHLEIWSACLGAPVLFHDTRELLTDRDWGESLANSWWLEPQLDYLRHHLTEIEGACQPSRLAETVTCLEQPTFASWVEADRWLADED